MQDTKQLAGALSGRSVGDVMFNQQYLFNFQNFKYYWLLFFKLY